MVTETFTIFLLPRIEFDSWMSLEEGFIIDLTDDHGHTIV